MTFYDPETIHSYGIYLSQYFEFYIFYFNMYYGQEVAIYDTNILLDVKLDKN